MKRFDAIVIGAGGLGSAVVYHLARAGLKTAGIDRFDPPHDAGSSHGGTRLFRKAYFEDARYIPLLERSHSLWKELSAESGKNLYHATGFLIMSRESESPADRAAQNAGRCGIVLETLRAKELRRRFPQFRLEDDHRGLLEPGGGYLEVETAIRAHLDLARRAGAVLRFEERVLSWESRERRVHVRTDKEEYEAETLVLAPGAWSSGLIGEFGMTLTVRRAPQFWFSGADRHDESRGMPCFAFAEDGRFIYGFPNVAPWGIKAANYEPSTILNDPLERNPNYTVAELDPVARIVTRRLVGVDPVPVHSNICMHTLTQDENFVVDRHPHYENVYLLTGDSGHAFKFAPVLGEIVAGLAAGRSPGFDLDFLSCRQSRA